VEDKILVLVHVVTIDNTDIKMVPDNALSMSPNTQVLYCCMV